MVWSHRKALWVSSLKSYDNILQRRAGGLIGHSTTLEEVNEGRQKQGRRMGEFYRLNHRMFVPTAKFVVPIPQRFFGSNYDFFYTTFYLWGFQGPHHGCVQYGIAFACRVLKRTPVMERTLSACRINRRPRINERRRLHPTAHKDILAVVKCAGPIQVFEGNFVTTQ